MNIDKQTTKSYFFFFFLFIALTGVTLAQQLSLDLGELWEGNYNPERLEAIRSMKDGSHYTVLEQNQTSKTSTIASYAYANAQERKVLFDSNQLPDFD